MTASTNGRGRTWRATSSTVPRQSKAGRSSTLQAGSARLHAARVLGGTPPAAAAGGGPEPHAAGRNPPGLDTGLGHHQPGCLVLGLWLEGEPDPVAAPTGTPVEARSQLPSSAGPSAPGPATIPVVAVSRNRPGRATSRRGRGTTANEGEHMARW